MKNDVCACVHHRVVSMEQQRGAEDEELGVLCFLLLKLFTDTAAHNNNIKWRCNGGIKKV